MNRQEELIRILLKSKKPLTTTELAEMLDVSSRTIRSDLVKIETELLVHHLCLEKKPHVGVWIQGAKEDKVALFLNVDQQNRTVNTYSKDYRIGCMLVQILLGNSKIYPDKFADELYVSRSTIEKDLSAVLNGWKNISWSYLEMQIMDCMLKATKKIFVMRLEA